MSKYELVERVTGRIIQPGEKITFWAIGSVGTATFLKIVKSLHTDNAFFVSVNPHELTPWDADGCWWWYERRSRDYQIIELGEENGN